MGHILSLLMPFIIYFLLLLPPSICFLVVIAKGKKFFKKGMIILFTVSIPLIVKIRSDYIIYKESKYKYPGEYYLTEYPNCTSCTLHLKKNKTYIIINDSTTLEKGTWNYRKGSSYAIITMNSDKQLGVGNYSYDTASRTKETMTQFKDSIRQLSFFD
ncbi:hypothetical protein [uncultured Kordia sp.]|uniref:hypothetical protein n=1 Tax=uncultured Kordia sp. TaxID=507699 RepID=UPI00260C5D1C|nr:hypothetical protein [uncultured Kordia sp.]